MWNLTISASLHNGLMQKNRVYKSSIKAKEGVGEGGREEGREEREYLLDSPKVWTQCQSPVPSSAQTCISMKIIKLISYF